MKKLKLCTISILILITNPSFGYFCSSSKKKLMKLPQNLLKNFRFESGSPQTQGPNFGLTQKSLEKKIELIKNCKDKIHSIGLEQCLTNDILPVLEMRLKRLEATNNHKKNSLAFEISDEDYFKYVPKQALVLPDELRDGLPTNWRELAKNNPNWTAIQYRSRTVGNPPNPNRSYARVLIQVDETPFEKWIQFTIPQPCSPGEKIFINLQKQARCDEDGIYHLVPDGYSGVYSPTELESWPVYEKVERLVDYIAIDKSTDPNKIYFSQYWRDENGKNPQRRDQAHGDGNFDTCYTCHPNGIRQISPSPGSVRKEDLESFKQLTSKISTYNNLDWGPAINPKAYGPNLGSKENCTSCHNNKITGRGALNYMTTLSHINHKMQGDFSMNPVFRKSEETFLKNMQQISQFISEKDRQEIEKQISQKKLDGSSTAYDLVLDYIDKNQLPVDFSTAEYRKILKKLTERNKHYSASQIIANIGTQFKENLLANCNTAMEASSSSEEIYDEDPAYTPFSVEQIISPENVREESSEESSNEE